MAKVKELVVARPRPELSLSAKDLPAIKNWKVGGKYQLLVDVEQVSMSKGDDWEPGLRARFKVTKIKEANDGKD